MNRAEFETYLSETYSAMGDHPWMTQPDYTAFRHANQKWFAVVMKIPKEKVGLAGKDSLDVVNLKCDPLLIGSLVSEPGVFPAFHMNKEHWITVALDGSAADDKLRMLADISFTLTAPKSRKKPEKI